MDPACKCNRIPALPIPLQSSCTSVPNTSRTAFSASDNGRFAFTRPLLLHVSVLTREGPCHATPRVSSPIIARVSGKQPDASASVAVWSRVAAPWPSVNLPWASGISWSHAAPGEKVVNATRLASKHSHFLTSRAHQSFSIISL